MAKFDGAIASSRLWKKARSSRRRQCTGSSESGRVSAAGGDEPGCGPIHTRHRRRDRKIVPIAFIGSLFRRLIRPRALEKSCQEFKPATDAIGKPVFASRPPPDRKPAASAVQEILIADVQPGFGNEVPISGDSIPLFSMDRPIPAPTGEKPAKDTQQAAPGARSTSLHAAAGPPSPRKSKKGNQRETTEPRKRPGRPQISRRLALQVDGFEAGPLDFGALRIFPADQWFAPSNRPANLALRAEYAPRAVTEPKAAGWSVHGFLVGAAHGTEDPSDIERVGIGGRSGCLLELARETFGRDLFGMQMKYAFPPGRKGLAQRPGGGLQRRHQPGDANETRLPDPAFSGQASRVFAG
jgi:hypothetical protein